MKRLQMNFKKLNSKIFATLLIFGVLPHLTANAQSSTTPNAATSAVATNADPRQEFKELHQLKKQIKEEIFKDAALKTAFIEAKKACVAQIPAESNDKSGSQLNCREWKSLSASDQETCKAKMEAKISAKMTELQAFQSTLNAASGDTAKAGIISSESCDVLKLLGRHRHHHADSWQRGMKS